MMLLVLVSGLSDLSHFLTKKKKTKNAGENSDEKHNLFGGTEEGKEEAKKE